MEKLIVNSYEDFASHLGEVLGTSEWLQIDRDRINMLLTQLSTTNGFT